MSYNTDTDYQAKINEAVSKGDYKSAAKYEKSRNEKIDGENLSYEKTNNYSGWLDDTDYSIVLNKQISTGAPKKSVSDTLKKRIEKASGTVGLSEYAHDDVYDKAVKYIMGNNTFSYEKEAPRYQDAYSSQIRNLYSELSSMKPFSYNPYEDDVFKYYKEQYNREGERAMRDLLGEISMNTGGVASSYAVSAAGQMLDYYSSKLTDKIPELYSDAYNRYLDGIALKRDNLKTLSELDDDSYERYLDSIKQYNDDRDFSYKVYSDLLDSDFRQAELDRLLKEDERDYENTLKELELETEENNRKWELQEKEDAVGAALKKWQQMGYLDSESAQILGLPVGTHTSDYDYKKAQQYKIYNK